MSINWLTTNLSTRYLGLQFVQLREEISLYDLLHLGHVLLLVHHFDFPLPVKLARYSDHLTFVVIAPGHRLAGRSQRNFEGESFHWRLVGSRWKINEIFTKVESFCLTSWSWSRRSSGTEELYCYSSFSLLDHTLQFLTFHFTKYFNWVFFNIQSHWVTLIMSVLFAQVQEQVDVTSQIFVFLNQLLQMLDMSCKKVTPIHTIFTSFNTNCFLRAFSWAACSSLVKSIPGSLLTCSRAVSIFLLSSWIFWLASKLSLFLAAASWQRSLLKL